MYRAKVTAPAQLQPLPADLDHALASVVIASLSTGTVVDVICEDALGLWALVRVGHLAGWLSTGVLKRLPWIIVDLYRGDLGGKPDISRMVVPGIHGLILKATQGTKYPQSWFQKHWRAARELAGDRYGASWCRGAYHYLEFYQDAKAQAEHYARAVEAAGGWGPGDLRPIVDVEDGKETSPNANADANRVIDQTSTYALHVTKLTGRAPMLYGGHAIRSRKITSHMGCSGLWVARYGPTLPASTYTKMGWELARSSGRGYVWGWQYAGTDQGCAGRVKGLPSVIGVGQVDLTVAFAQTYAELVG